MKKSIFLLMGHSYLSHLLRNFLTDMGFVCRFSNDLTSLLPHVENETPLCMISEPRVSDMEHLELLCLLKSHPTLHDVPLILLDHRQNPRQEDSRPIDELIDYSLTMPLHRKQIRTVMNRCMICGTPKTTFSFESGWDPSNIMENPLKNSFLTGALNLERVSHLVNNLDRYHATGLLSILQNDLRMQIYIRCGQVVNVTSNHLPDDSLGALLNRLEVIPSNHVSDLYFEAQDQQMYLGQWLLEKNILDFESLLMLLKTQKLTKLFKLFSDQWEGASFSFWPWNLNESANPIDPYPLSKILKNGIFHFAPFQTITQILNEPISHKDDYILLMNSEEISKRFELDPEKIPYTKLSSRSSLNTLKHRNPKAFEKWLRLMMLFHVSHGLKHVPKSPPEEKSRPAFSAVPKTKVEAISESIKKAMTSDLESILCRCNSSYQEQFSSALILIHLKNYKGAVHALKKMIHENPDCVEARALVPWCNVLSKRGFNLPAIVAAKKELYSITKKCGESAFVFYLLGKLHRKTANYDLAERCLNRAGSLLPGSSLIKDEITQLPKWHLESHFHGSESIT